MRGQVNARGRVREFLRECGLAAGEGIGATATTSFGSMPFHLAFGVGRHCVTHHMGVSDPRRSTALEIMSEFAEKGHKWTSPIR
ncbi:hypothetical protein Misp01_09880 [Microtetraspora sp. NBRC 13810]|nr:hypothetical protein Misp01_09880 [Microtetraspora sp. NBRC 13810]